MSNERYIQFPLFLIRDMFLNKQKSMSKIITFGIYNYSRTFKNCEAKIAINDALESLNITGNIDYILKEGKKIKPHNDPQPSINTSLLFDFRDKDKTEFEIAQLLAYIAIRSILGKRQYVKTNKAHIVSRMFGYASVNHLPVNFHGAIEALFKKYSNRYHIDKVLQALELNWYVLTYSRNLRGLYVAMNDKIELEALIFAAEGKKRKILIENLNTKKREAREKALQQLNKEQQL